MIVLLPLVLALNVRDLGAKGDGIAKDTAAIQAAVDAGGVVTIPAGRYLSGTIHLKSSVSINLESGATLVMSPDAADFDAREKLFYPVYDDADTTYFHNSLLAGEDIHDVAFYGGGVIDGNRTRRGGPKPVGLKLCQNVSIRGITIRNAPNYAISLLACDLVNIDGVSIENGYADGIDPDSCHYVRITNCYIESRDDAIAVKSSWALGEKRASENLTVSNCHLRTSKNAFKFGSESAGDLRNVTLTNCTMTPRDEGSRPNSAILLETLDGGNIENITISNIVSTGAIVPFLFRLGTRLRGGSVPGSMREIQVSNLIATHCLGTGSVTGIPGKRVEGISLTGIDITAEGNGVVQEKLPGDENDDKREQFGPLPASGFYARHAAQVTLSRFRVKWEKADPRPVMLFDDVNVLEIDGVKRDQVTLLKVTP